MSEIPWTMGAHGHVREQTIAIERERERERENGWRAHALVHTARLRPGCKQAGRRCRCAIGTPVASAEQQQFSWRLAVAMGMQTFRQAARGTLIVSFPKRVIDESAPVLRAAFHATVDQQRPNHPSPLRFCTEGTVAVAFCTTFPRVLRLLLVIILRYFAIDR